MPAGRPVVSGTTISATAENAFDSDLATEITNSLDRTGKGAMQAALKLVDGSVAAPGVAFSNETGTGWFRNAASDLRMAISGVLRAAYNSVGHAWTAATADGASAVAFTFDTTTSLTNATAKIVSVKTAAAEKFAIMKDGAVISQNARHTPAYVGSDLTTTSSTLSNLTGVAFVVSASGVYEWEATLIVSRASTATSLLVGVSGPAAPTAVTQTVYGYNAGVSNLATTTSFGAGGLTAYGGGAGTGQEIVKVLGVLRNGSNAGTVQLTFSSSDNVNTVTVSHGSFIVWRRMDAVE